MSTQKIYTEKQVKSLLKKQRKACSVIPILNTSRGRTDWREWNKFLRDMSKCINSIEIKL